MPKRISILIAICLVASLLLAGCAKPVNAPVATQTPEPVKLTVVGAWTDFRALDEVAKGFMQEHPGCTVVYEYLQDYYASLDKRAVGDTDVDLFVTTNIQEGSNQLAYALDLYSREDIALSDTFNGLIDNFVFRDSDASAKRKLYAVPMGAEMRGLYVNKTLLETVGITSIPTNQTQLLAACQTLKDKGYIPFFGNPGTFGHLLNYPWICSQIANSADYAATHKKVNEREAGVAELFREPMQFLYTLAENGYYDYKRAQSEAGLFFDSSDESNARDILNIKKNGETYEKVDDVGIVAFYPGAMSFGSVLTRVKEDYHSKVEFVFVPAPVGVDGGYVYLSPGHGIAVCKNSKNVDMAVQFINHIFKPENNKILTKALNLMPNTREAFSYISAQFDIPSTRISHLGQVTFDYNFYSIVCASMVDIAKANNPKYMIADDSGAMVLKPLDTFMAELEGRFAE